MFDVTLTKKQHKVYCYYMSYISKWEESPTYSQAGNELWISPSVVHNHIKNLCKKWIFFITPRWEVKDIKNQYTGIDSTPPILGEQPYTAFSHDIKRKFTKEDIKWMLSSIMGDPAQSYIDNAVAWFKNYWLLEE